MTQTRAEYQAEYFQRRGKQVQQQRQAERKERTDAIKLAAGCMDCDGVEWPAVCLDFDHRPGEVKLFQIGGSGNRGWAVVEAEIAKCDVVCANHHRLRTMDRADWTKGRVTSAVEEPS